MSFPHPFFFLVSFQKKSGTTETFNSSCLCQADHKFSFRQNHFIDLVAPAVFYQR